PWFCLGNPASASTTCMPLPITLPNTVYGPPAIVSSSDALSARLMNHWLVALSGPLNRAIDSVPTEFGIPASLAIVPWFGIAVNCDVLENVALDVVKPPACSTKPGSDRWKIESVNEFVFT